MLNTHWKRSREAKLILDKGDFRAKKTLEITPLYNLKHLQT